MKGTMEKYAADTLATRAAIELQVTAGGRLLSFLPGGGAATRACVPERASVAAL